MTDRPGDPDPPIEKELALPRWVMFSVVILGLLTVLLVGTAVAISTTGGPDEPRASATTPAPSPTEPSPTSTPGTPLANVECDGSYIVELGRSRPPYEKSSVEKLVTETRDAKYLEADQSCETYQRAGNRLIAYVGPFDDLGAACAKRVESQNVRAVPHLMEAGQRGHDYCACEVDPPTLRRGDGGAGENPEVLMAIGEAQKMLKDLGYFQPNVVGDPFGPDTQQAVQGFQIDVGLPATGVVNRATWAALRESTAPGGPPLC